MNKVNVISLGCSKNLVDSELLLKQLAHAGYRTETDAENSDAEVVVINTCGFIGDAKEESVNTILEQVERKKAGIVKRLLVMGCLSQRYGDELRKEIPEADAFFGKFDWKGILADLGQHYEDTLRNQRQLTTPGHYAYLKIAEGCNRTCSYCAIPIMTGKYQSRGMDEILEECRELVKNGVKELLVIAQDLTYYGTDLYGRNKLAELVERISDIPGVEWIKLHYAYPAAFPEEILKVMRERDNVCKYLDIALQHCSDSMLKMMRRGVDKLQTIRLVEKIRQEVPGIFLRTTLMTGHPGETEKDFEELCEFVSRMKFERLGVFPYSHEEDTYCDLHYEDNVPEEIKRQRAEKIMELQAGVSEKLNNSLIGKVFKVLVDRKEDNYYIGRTEHDSPEVDPEVLIEGAADLQVSNFYLVKITGADEYDLYGSIAEETSGK
ncbi:MAG: 30S ribosomal protein S12 methylthiotransferase RimO [Odoribacter sp.]|nr:30S ribosomal protein S12 methylthiotransferase RimO [Odoribacter sp.]MDE6877536.1 30S ribosomal protein S12 methylthiotransferase RimO [Odoribacter sp.]